MQPSVALPRVARPALQRGCGVVRKSGSGAIPSHPIIVDHGGRVLTAAAVQLIYWGKAWCSDEQRAVSDTSDAMTRVLTGPYLSALEQYRGAGHAWVEHSALFCELDPPAAFSNEVVASFIFDRIAEDQLPTPESDADRLFLVVMPPGVPSWNPDVLGAHSFFGYFAGDGDADSTQPNAHFAWVSGDGSLDDRTSRISHLIAEACTDPEGDGYRVQDEAPGDDWLEIADLCATPLRIGDIAVTAYWSQQPGRCISAQDVSGTPGHARRVLALPAATPPPREAAPTPRPANTELPAITPAVPPPLPASAGRRPQDSPYIAGLLATAPLVPLVGLVVSGLAFIVAFAPAGIHARHAAPFLGLVVSLSAWLLGGMVARRLAIPQLANTDESGQIRLRLEQLRSRINALLDPARPALQPEGPGALREARDLAAILEDDLTQPGIRWVLAHGFITAWKTIHRAEEALFIADGVERIVAEGLNDELRLEDSQIPHSDVLATKVRHAVEVLSPLSGDRYLHSANGAAAISKDDGAGVDPGGVARNVLRMVRRAINEYRDDLWSGLIRARNQLRRSILITGVISYLLLVDLLFAGLDSRAVVGASVFFIFGGLIGLVARLRNESGADKAVEDFGLESARLIAAPLLSGLASVFGVLIMGLAHVNVLGVSFGPAPPAGTSVPALGDIFNLRTNPTGFIGAALFGLTPSLLIDYLQAQTNSFKQALKISEATGGADSKPQPKG
jgi:hypothetical protein